MAIVDSYKAMFKRMASERNALVERNVELEYQNQSLQSRLDALADEKVMKLSTHNHILIRDKNIVTKHHFQYRSPGLIQNKRSTAIKAFEIFLVIYVTGLDVIST